MPPSGVYSIKSFIMVIYDANLAELARYQVPLSVAAPFANRVFSEALERPDWKSTVREPWYTIAPRYLDDPPLQRSTRPTGPTSLYGTQYDPAAESGPMIGMDPDASVRYFVVRLLDFQEELFRGEYSVDDIFLHGARYLLQHRIDKGEIPSDRGPYYYAVLPGLTAVRSVAADLFPEDAYKVEGVFRLPPRVKDEPRIQFRPVAEPPLPERDLSSWPIAQSVGKGDPQAGRVLMPARLYEDLRRILAFSSRDEEGGYVLGHVYRQPGSPEAEGDPAFRWVVEITDLLMANGTVGSPARLLFTGDAWSGVNRRRDREFADRKLVGWFHTHVFPATDTFGLSGLDQDMHSWYLPRPWQVAILLNLEGEGRDRTVRCYQRGPQGELVETPFDILA